MAGDPLKPLKPGDPIPTSVRTWNPILEVARYRKVLLPGAGEGGPRSIEIMVRNSTGADVERQACLTLNGVAVTAAANLRQFRSQPVLDGFAPDPSHIAKLAVTVEPIRNGKPGRAIVSGATAVQVDLADGDTHAVPIAGDTAKLRGATSGHLLLYRPESNGVQWCVVLLGAMVESTCVDPQQATIETWIPNAAHTKLLQVITTQWLDRSGGCIRLNSESLATGEWVALCCEGSGGCPSTGSGSEILFAATCPGWDGALIGGGGSYGPSFKGTFHEIFSFDPSITTVHDGDIISFRAEWGFREDCPGDSAIVGSVCCLRPFDDAGCNWNMAVSGLNCLLELISTDTLLPGPCMRRGEIYHVERTYRVIFTGDCDVNRTIQAQFEVGNPSTGTSGGIGGCSVVPAGASIIMNESGTFDCPDDVPPPAGVPSPCPDSSGSGPSGSDPGSGSSGPGTSEPSSGGPGFSEPGGGLGGGLGP